MRRLKITKLALCLCAGALLLPAASARAHKTAYRKYTINLKPLPSKGRSSAAISRLNRRYTFGDRTPGVARQWARFAIVNLGGGFVNYLVYLALV